MPAPDDADREVRSAAGEDARKLNELVRSGDAEELQALDPANKRLALEEREHDLDLKRRYGRNLFRLMLAQLVVADAAFFLYAALGVDWNVPPSVMHVWLAATVVEVIGVVYVVTRYLFPNRDAQAAGG